MRPWMLSIITQEFTFADRGEMSIVQSDLLDRIRERLQQFKQNTELFSNVAMILFGYLLQLKPVRGNFIERPRDERL